MQGIIKAESKPEKYFEEKCFITEIINTADFVSFSLSKAKVSPGTITDNHRIKDTEEVYFVLSGKGEMNINGKVVGIVEKDDVVFIPKNAGQQIQNIGTDDLVFLCICSPRFVVENYEGI